MFRSGFLQVAVAMIFAGALFFGFGPKAEAQTALASWYGNELAGNPTASGEPYNPYGLTAAHKTLPLGTPLTVSYGGQSVDVVVNDRGPYVGDRELDLSLGAANALGLTGSGVDYVNVSQGGSAPAQPASEPVAPEPAAVEPTVVESVAPETAAAEPVATEPASVPVDTGVAGGAYTVQQGDTLNGISSNLGVTVEQLVAANGIADPNLIFTGQTLYY